MSRTFKHMCVKLMDVYLSSRSLADFLNASDVVEVTVGEEYLCKAELSHFEEFQEQSAVAADINGNASSRGSLDYIAVSAERSEL